MNREIKFRGLTISEPHWRYMVLHDFLKVEELRYLI